MDTAKVISVIETTILRRGEGLSPDDPLCIIAQYWSLDGVLLAEVDPWQGKSSDSEKTRMNASQKQAIEMAIRHEEDWIARARLELRRCASAELQREILRHTQKMAYLREDLRGVSTQLPAQEK